MSLSKNELKLHLGCGDKYLDGFKHVDLAKFVHVEYQQDVRDLSCFGDNSVSLIYACHVLQYFDLQEVVGVLKEWQRVLNPGGILRLAVPDFAVLIHVYYQDGSGIPVLGPLYGPMSINGKTIYHSSLASILGPLYGRMSVDGETIYHKAVYDFATLSTLLRSVSFRSIHRWDWRKTEHSDVDDCSQAYWPHMDKENGILISLNVEARKAQ